MSYLVATAWVKNEGPYLAEWIEFHLLQGFEKFYFYDDGSTDETMDVLAPYIRDEVAEVRTYPPHVTKRKNFWVIKQTIDEFKGDHQWLFHHSIDEYMFCQNGKRVVDFLKDFEQHSGVCIPWRFFTSNGHEKKVPGLVIERFQEYTTDDYYHIKTIVNPSKTIDCVGNPHVYNYSEGFAVYPNGVRHDTSGPHLGAMGNKNNYRTDLVRLNHYHVMSHEEYDNKMNKGLLDISQENERRANADSYWNAAHTGEKHIETFIQKYIPEVYSNLKKRYRLL